MIEISWGETFVLLGVSCAVIGKKDLPRFAGYLGRGVGRAVGLLQGARHRAEAYAQETELRQLHREFTSGLNELSAVRYEMDSTMNPSRRMMSSELIKPIKLTHEQHSPAGMGATTSATTTSAMASMRSNNSLNSTAAGATPSIPPAIDPSMLASSTPVSPTLQSTTASVATETPTPSSESLIHHRELPPESQTIGAVAEEEWEKQGMGFTSRAERGAGIAGLMSEEQVKDSGSSILANIYKQNLIHDQYDRVTQYQENILKSQHQHEEGGGQGSSEKDKTQ